MTYLDLIQNLIALTGLAAVMLGLSRLKQILRRCI